MATKERNTRKAINFDLKEKPLKIALEEGTTGFKNRSEAWARIGRFLIKSGFRHDQNSGYVSVEGMNSMRASEIIEDLGEAFPWLKTCMAECRLTSIESLTEMKEFIVRGAERVQAGGLTVSPATYAPTKGQ